jgi:hypothetical protein
VRDGVIDGQDGLREVQDTFRRAEALHTSGDIAGAVEAYRRIGPSLPQLISHPGRDGLPVFGPDFIIIGAPRSGTTWLKKWLARHEQVFIQSGEGTYFFYSPHRSARAYVASYASVAARFLKLGGPKLQAWSDPQARKVLGEKSPSYLIAPETYVDLCATLFPNVRLICIMREPVSRAWSHIKLWGHAEGVEASVEARANGDFSPLDEILSYGRYREHLLRWRRRFPADQFLLLDFDRIASEPIAVYDEVLRHIGADVAPAIANAPKAEPGAMKDLPPPPDLIDLLNREYEGEAFDAATLTRVLREAPGPG